MKRRIFYLSALALFLLTGGFIAIRYEVQKSREQEGSTKHTFSSTYQDSRNQDRDTGSRRWTVEEDEPVVVETPAENRPGTGSTGKARPFVELPEELAVFDRTVLEKRPVEKLSWKSGLAWKVESYYLRMDQPGEPSWTEKPIVWDFEVLGTEKIGDEEVYVVEVSPEDLTGMPYNPGGKVYISTENHTVVALKDRILEAGVVKDRFLSFSDPGSGALSTLIPLELPPPGAEGHTSIDLGSFGLNTPGPSAPKGSDKVASGSDVVEVAFESNGVTIHQGWDSSTSVWPVYSSTPYRVSYLRKGS